MVIKELKCDNDVLIKIEETPYYYKVTVGGKTWYWTKGTGKFDGTSFGWKTDIDNDLICVKPHANTTLAGEITLSPVYSNWLWALCAFIMKAILIRIDQNLRGLES